MTTDTPPKIALVTGAGNGIGRTVALDLLFNNAGANASAMPCVGRG